MSEIWQFCLLMWSIFCRFEWSLWDSSCLSHLDEVVKVFQGSLIRRCLTPVSCCTNERPAQIGGFSGSFQSWITKAPKTCFVLELLKKHCLPEQSVCVVEPFAFDFGIHVNGLQQPHSLCVHIYAAWGIWTKPTWDNALYLCDVLCSTQECSIREKIIITVTLFNIYITII